jgi:Na+/H+ antiporter NhaC
LSEAGHRERGRQRRGRWLAGVAIVVAALLWFLRGGVTPTAAGHYGLASALPALLTLVLVFLTREVILSLLVGIVVGGIVIGNWNVLEAFIFPSVGTPSFALILVVYLWALGGLIGIWTRTGGAHHFARLAARRTIRGPRSARFFTWLLGLIFHQGGTTSVVLVGTTVRPIADEQRVSHEETSFFVDTTGSPVASIIPLNVWPIYVAGLAAGTVPFLTTQQEAIAFYFRSVPFNFYALVVIGLALLLALGVLPWTGRRMAEATTRARVRGELDRPGARPLTGGELGALKVPAGYAPGLVDFIVPMGVLLGVVLVGIASGLAGGIGAMRIPIAEAFALAVLSAGVVAWTRGMAFAEIMDGFVDGVKGVTIGALMLALAVTLGEVTRSLGTAAFLVELTAGWIAPLLLPAFLFVLSLSVAFATGMSWGTYPVTLPIALPLAYAVNPDPLYVSHCFAAVIGGGVFGDHTSPLSDTTILASLSTGADLMDHVLTQLPLAVGAAAVAALLHVVTALALALA